MPESPPASRFGSHVLLIFVGYSSDGREAADTIVALQPSLQEELDNLVQTKPAFPFHQVKIWTWEDDASAAVGGQAVVVTPELERANVAVFVFKERIGKLTWQELTVTRDRTPWIHVLPYFPGELQAVQQML